MAVPTRVTKRWQLRLCLGSLSGSNCTGYIAEHINFKILMHIMCSYPVVGCAPSYLRCYACLSCPSMTADFFALLCKVTYNLNFCSTAWSPVVGTSSLEQTAWQLVTWVSWLFSCGILKSTGSPFICLWFCVLLLLYQFPIEISQLQGRKRFFLIINIIYMYVCDCVEW